MVEAAIRSGALHTARAALDLGRPVGAVPGPVTSVASAGCHQLVRESGATLVTDPDEVLDLVAPIGAQTAPPQRAPRLPVDDLPSETARVLEALPVSRGRPLGVICAVAGLDEQTTARSLARLCLLGLAELSGPGWRIARTRGSAKGSPIEPP